MHSVLGNHKTMIHQYIVIVVIHVYNRIIVFTQQIYTKTHKIALYFIFIHRENDLKAHQHISYCFIEIYHL